ncbi:MAG: flagellar export chaperone FliS [Phycisphaerales bacterium]|nr:flagellar export chaperone FliS [Phycisphaerales bacterium]MCB9836570.1 flagellar export chaperone FliS [Phycisphaera sp.]
MSKPQDNANAYLRTQVMSASPAELRMMLLDGAVKFARQGRQGLAEQNHELVYTGFSQARAIVTELMTSMRHDVAPELCEQVRSLYAFMFQELVAASLESDINRADKVIELLEFEAETWRMLMAKLKTEETEAGATTGAAPTQAKPNAYAPAGESKPGAYTPLSIEG